MEKLYVIDVTEDDIKGANKGDCYMCPIALAVRKRLGINEISRVLVGINEIVIYMTSEDRMKFCLPDEVYKFINDFDTKERSAVKPFRFVLNLGF